jgi:hypothetical protein
VSGCLFRRGGVGERSADTAGPASKVRAALAPLKPCVGHGFKTLLPIIFFLRAHIPLHALINSYRQLLLRFQPARDSTAAMSNWTCSNVSREQLLHLVEAG